MEFLAASLRIATPLLFAALGGILSERAGIFAVGLEGMMLAGAFAGVIASQVLGSLGWGLVASVLGGAFVALIVAIATVRFGADQMVTGLAVNILALGLTSFLLRGLFARGEAPIIRVATLTPLPMPVLADIPVVGPLLFRQPPLTYLAGAAVVAVALFLARTRAGLTLRATGENPRAVFAVGADPARAGGRAARLRRAGGAGRRDPLAPTSGNVRRRHDQRPRLHRARCHHRRPLDAARYLPRLRALWRRRCSAAGLPAARQLYVIQMTPYVVALAGLGRSARLPAALGVPFLREGR